MVLYHLLKESHGATAPLFPVLVAILGAIVFLEVNVPRIIATWGTSALAYFLLAAAMFGAGGPARGGIVGADMWLALRSLVGVPGAWILLVLAALSLTLWLTNASLKQLIGRVIVFFGGLRPPPMPSMPKMRVEIPPGHHSLREAFAIPQPPPAPIVPEPMPQASPSSPAPLLPLPFVPRPAPREKTVEEDPPTAEVAGEYEPAGDAGGARAYRLPDLSLFDPPQAQVVDDSNRAHVLEDTLASFGVGAKVDSHRARTVDHALRAQTRTRHQDLEDRVALRRSRARAGCDERAHRSADPRKIRGRHRDAESNGLDRRDSRDSRTRCPTAERSRRCGWRSAKTSPGGPVFGDLSKMPHLLVAGATGAGKSVCLNTIIASLLVNATPDQVQLLMIDPKRVELTVYNGIPHLIKDAITDARLAAGALFEMTKEMDSRYERFAKAGVRKIEEYNAKYPRRKRCRTS